MRGQNGECMDRDEILKAYRNIDAARRAVGRALRRRDTYTGAAKEIATAGLNIALYPAGIVSKAFQPDNDSMSPSGRFDRQLPLRYLDPDAANMPIVLVHGYFHNRSAFLIVRRALRRAGFRNVTTLNYNVVGHDVEALARQLGAHVDRVLRDAGAETVHLIGHSLGGLVARAYIQLGDGEEKVHTCITLGTPHHGTFSAFAGRGRAARDLRPSSPLFDRLANTGPSNVRFVSYYSNLDAMIIPASSAILISPNLIVRNVLVKDLGHMSLLISQGLIGSIIDALWHLDTPTGSVTPIGKKRRSRTSRAV